MAQPFTYTVRQLCYELGLYLNDSLLLNAAANSADTTHYNAQELTGQTVDSLIGSEFWPWDRPTGDASLTYFPPAFVTGNDAAGILTLSKALFAPVYHTGERAVLQNFNGRGFPQVKKEFALKMACMEVYRLTSSTVQAITTPSVTDYWNNLPAALRSVYRVAYWDAASGQEREIAPATWQDRLDSAGWRVNLPFDWTGTDEARIYGRADPTAWWDNLRPFLESSGSVQLSAYSASVPGDPRKLILAAVPWLVDAKRDKKAQADVEYHYTRLLREGLNRPFPNEVFKE